MWFLHHCNLVSAAKRRCSGFAPFSSVLLIPTLSSSTTELEFRNSFRSQRSYDSSLTYIRNPFEIFGKTEGWVIHKMLDHIRYCGRVAQVKKIIIFTLDTDRVSHPTRFSPGRLIVAQKIPLVVTYKKCLSSCCMSCPVKSNIMKLPVDIPCNQFKSILPHFVWVELKQPQALYIYLIVSPQLC